MYKNLIAIILMFFRHIQNAELEQTHIVVQIIVYRSGFLVFSL